MEALKKTTKMSPAELRKYEDWYRNEIGPEKRADEYKTVVGPMTPPPAPPLSMAEEKMLKELLGKFSAKDKEGKSILNADELKKYEAWYRDQPSKVRLEEYNREMEAPPPAPKKTSQDSAPARLLVHLPADAVLTIDGNATRSTSASRWFESPLLNTRGMHFYELQATVERAGMQIQVNRLVRVQPGQTIEVNIDVPLPHRALVMQR